MSFSAAICYYLETGLFDQISGNDLKDHLAIGQFGTFECQTILVIGCSLLY
jgi:hypothetical protein